MQSIGLYPLPLSSSHKRPSTKHVFETHLYLKVPIRITNTLFTTLSARTPLTLPSVFKCASNE